jgi:hypothetical protein
MFGVKLYPKIVSILIFSEHRTVGRAPVELVVVDVCSCPWFFNSLG